jgi:hypothetical protein
VKKRLRWRLVITIVLLLITFVSILIRDVTHSLSHMTPYGELSPALLPTAEYLERNPIQPRGFISGVASRPNEDRTICLTMVTFTNPLRASTTVDWLAGQRFSIDGYFTFPSVIGPLAWQTACFDVSNLSAGLHLGSVELTTRDGVKHTYTWAFRLEPTPDA